MIYKIKKKDFDKKGAVKADKIKISYKEQTDFFKTNHTTNFDCEAIASVKDSLYLFTKNWGDAKTSVYVCPKQKGKYKLKKKVTFPIGAMVTGADYSTEQNQFLLTAYNRDYESFIFTLKNFKNHPFDGEVQEIEITSSLGYANQIEAISWKNNTGYYFSREASKKKLHETVYDRKQKLFLGEIKD